jgi:hypothetical protein
MPNHTGLSPEELEQQSAAELPDREVMTLINTDPGMLSTYPDTPVPSGMSDSATGTATQASDLTQSQVPASGSESGTESVVSSPRSDVISQQDSAYAGPE